VMIERLLLIDEKLTIEKVDEEYTSVQSWETTGDFTKNIAEDTVAAMHILETYLKNEKNNV
jgi:RNase H-fold protein (predicted Holliday junction resolvase)